MPSIQVSPINSEEFLLDMLWISSLILAAVSALVLLMLIARRMIQEHSRLKRARRKKEFQHKMHVFLNAPIDPHKHIFAVLAPGDETLVCDVALEMFRVLRGQDEQKLIALLTNWNIAPFLRRSLLKGRRGDRVRAVTLVAHLGYKENLYELLTCAEDKDPYVQMAAMRGIAQHKNPKHLSLLVEYLIASPHQKNTLMLSDVLKRFGEPAVSQLLVLATSNANLEVRIAAVQALASIGSPEIVDSLINLVLHGENGIRVQAMKALGKLGDRRAHLAVIVGLDSGNDPLRIAATRVAGLLNLQQATPRLMALCGDPVWWVRFRAADALHQMGAAGIDILTSMSVHQSTSGEIARQVLAENESKAA